MKIEKYLDENISSRIGNPRNSSGFHRVTKDYSCIGYRRGYCWVYVGQKNRVRHTIRAPTILELERKVKAKGLEWEVVDRAKARNTLMEEMEND